TRSASRRSRVGSGRRSASAVVTRASLGVVPMHPGSRSRITCAMIGGSRSRGDCCAPAAARRRPAAGPGAITQDTDGAMALAELSAFPREATGVRAMMNTTVDGAVTGADGTSGSLRNPDDSLVFGVLRALADVVLVGASTVRSEDYRRPQGRADLLSPSRRPGGGRRP